MNEERRIKVGVWRGEMAAGVAGSWRSCNENIMQ
jgi:hypothetical protein